MKTINNARFDWDSLIPVSVVMALISVFAAATAL